MREYRVQHAFLGYKAGGQYLETPVWLLWKRTYNINGII